MYSQTDQIDINRWYSDGNRAPVNLDLLDGVAAGGERHEHPSQEGQRQVGHLLPHSAIVLQVLPVQVLNLHRKNL